MEAGRSLRELFAELSHTGADPAELLRAAGYGDVPEPLVAEAIVSYAGTAPLEVAEHLAPFAVAHGPVPDPEVPPASTHTGLSLLASAPPVDAPDDGAPVDAGEPVDPALHGAPDDPDPDVEHADAGSVVGHVDAGHLVDHVDVDPSALDAPSAHPDAPTAPHHGDVDPAGVDGLDPGPSPVGPHLAPGSFGAGYDQAPVGTDDRPVDHGATGGADHDVDTFLAHDHDDDVAVQGHDVSHHDLYMTATNPAAALLDHDDHPDPTDLLDGDEQHHA